MRQLLTLQAFRTRLILEKLNVNRRHASNQRIARLLELLHEAARCQKLLWEDLDAGKFDTGQIQYRAAAAYIKNLYARWHKSRKVETNQILRKYMALLANVNHLLRRYRSAPVVQPSPEIEALRFSWELDRGRGRKNWENEVVRWILDLIERKEFHRLRKCRNCSSWFCGQTDHQVHCRDACRKQFATQNPKFKERRRLYMKKFRKEEREREERRRIKKYQGRSTK